MLDTIAPTAAGITSALLQRGCRKIKIVEDQRRHQVTIAARPAPSDRTRGVIAAAMQIGIPVRWRRLRPWECLRRNVVHVQVGQSVSFDQVWSWQFAVSMATFLALIAFEARAFFMPAPDSTFLFLTWLGLGINGLGLVITIYFRMLVVLYRRDRERKARR